MVDLIYHSNKTKISEGETQGRPQGLKLIHNQKEWREYNKAKEEGFRIIWLLKHELKKLKLTLTLYTSQLGNTKRK